MKSVPSNGLKSEREGGRFSQAKYVASTQVAQFAPRTSAMPNPAAEVSFFENDARVPAAPGPLRIIIN
jgi:hypothetical protein